MIQLPALAAFVCRQADAVYSGQAHVSGTTRPSDQSIGLGRSDHQAIAMVSRAMLECGKADAFASPHLLLHACTRPLGQWARGAVDEGQEGWEGLLLLDPDERMPTVDCRELAAALQGMLAAAEEAFFHELLTTIRSRYVSRGARVYTAVREFIVRNPITSNELIIKFLLQQQAPELMQVMGSAIYQRLAAASGRMISRCAHCGSVMRGHGANESCSLRQCRARNVAQGCAAESSDNLVRSSHAAMTYWVGPGLDEILVFDRLRAAGVDARLYPDFDACDVAIGDEIGIDLKSYLTPFTLAHKLNRSVGRLALYPRKIIGIGDELVTMNPSYLNQLQHALIPELGLEVKSVSQILGEFCDA